MATGGEVPGRSPGVADSEDLTGVKCQPCLEDGQLREVTGMCIDCDEHLCDTCFKHQPPSKPSRHHKLVDLDQMMQGQIRDSKKDTCTSTCPYHDDDVIKYYCVKHGMLGCTVCITLNHATCESVQYIQKVAKDLASNEEYKQAEMRLTSALETFKNVLETVKRNSAEITVSCLEALNGIRDFRQMVNETAGKIEAELIKKLQDIKSKELAEIAAIGKKYKATLDELNLTMNTISTLQKAQQHCNTYIEMIRTMDTLTALYFEIKQAEVDSRYIKRHIRFTPNQDTLDTLKQADIFGVLSGSSIENKAGTKQIGPIVQTADAQDINVKTGTDTSTCNITGITVLRDTRLVLADYFNTNIKMVNVHSERVMASLKLSSRPWDITTISSNTVAVTMPDQKKIVIVTVGDNAMNIDRTLDINGSCYGIDYKAAKLAVSCRKPHRVQILSIQGAILHDISAEPLTNPLYLTFGRDDATLYVSNYGSNNVVCVKLDGTVVATYTDRELQRPEQPVMDGNGEVLVCGRDSHNIHQITSDCKKIRVLLSKADGLSHPYAICFSEMKANMYVGMYSDIVKVYQIERAT